MKKIISLVLALTLVLSMGAPSLALTPSEKLEYVQTISKFIADYALNVSSTSDPFLEMFKKMLEDDEFYNYFMDSMLGQYDKYSLFVPAGDYATTYPTTSSYVGIGITMEQYGESVRIVSVSEGGPAHKAGFMAGDIVTAVNRKDVSKSDMATIANMVKGEKDTEVIITVKRVINGVDNYFTQTIKRAYIGVPNFTSKVMEDGIYYMDFTRFADLSTYVQFIFAIQDMAENNCRSLILDLRGNPGGEVDMALNIINRLLPTKETYFMTRFKEEGQYKMDFYESDGMGLALNKIIILQDGGTASASEMIIASLKDLKVAETVGTTTYGKARGQYHMTMPDGSVAVITGVELIAPLAKDYEEIGLEADHKVENTYEKDGNGIDVLVDHQMEKAMELAREYAKQPQQYTVDNLGNFKNIEKPQPKDEKPAAGN